MKVLYKEKMNENGLKNTYTEIKIHKTVEEILKRLETLEDKIIRLKGDV